MKRIYIYCEGQTEESFVNTVLAPYFFSFDTYLIPIICTTSRKQGQKHRGGAVNYEKIHSELTRLCRSHPSEHVTTMFDYYGMPKNTPGIGSTESDLYKKIKEIEARINENIGAANCHFHFMVHEFESLLFSNPEAFTTLAGEDVASALYEARGQFLNPEYINNSLETAPSKRILSAMPNYGKVRHGTILAQRIGIDKMMEECPHFRNWIEEMKAYE